MIRKLTARPLALAATVAVLLGILIAVPLVSAQSAKAADASDFDPGMLISDAQFYAGDAMSAQEVQDFLNSKGANCTDNCLKDHYADTYSIAASSFCDAYTSTGRESAAQIIAKVGQACGINPKALLVLLEKETSLVTMDGPGDWRYERATGYYCPDDPSRPGWCAPEYAGLFNQLYNAAAQFNRYRLNEGDYAYQAGRVNTIAYHPDSFSGGCGFQDVYIENQATAGLYIYTPYVPNQSALNNLYGEGDSCAAYGNRNFWRLFTDWFGDPKVDPKPAGVAPIGNYEAVQLVDGGIKVVGWAADFDQPKDAVSIAVTVDGTTVTRTAQEDRPDVGNAYPDLGPKHGFGEIVELPLGTHEVCVTVLGLGEGGDTELGCREATVVEGTPSGDFESAAGGVGEVHVTGWAFDPDASSASTVTLTWIGGTTDLVADIQRDDLGSGMPANGGAVGFDGTFAVPAGTTEVCAVVNGQGVGGDLDLGCEPVTVYAADPLGEVDAVTAVNGGIRVSGWAADPSLGTEAGYVKVTIGSQQAMMLAAGTYEGLSERHPSLGDRHGFDFVVALPPGSHDICVIAVDDGDGADTELKCETVKVPEQKTDEKGALDSAIRVDGGIKVYGWAWLAGANTDTTIEISVDGAAPTVLHTGGLRADLAERWGVPSNLGFHDVVAAGEGQHEVCAIATNRTSGEREDLGCLTVK